MQNIRGWQTWRGNLQRLERNAREDLTREVEKSARETAGLIKALAPRDEGDLAGSVRLDRGSNDLRVKIRAGGAATTKDGFDYARAVEHGANAEPFFWPIVRAQKRIHRARIARALRRAIERTMT